MRVVREPLSVPLRNGTRVIDEYGREGLVVGDRKQSFWFGRVKRGVKLWLLVEFPGGQRGSFAASELRAVEETAVVVEREEAVSDVA